MTAAISAARNGAEVRILEKNNRPGKKILITGNGRCNLSNQNLAPRFYHGSGKPLTEALFLRFGLKETLAFFRELGLEFYTDPEGRIYPASQQSSGLLDALRFEMEKLKIEGLYEQEVVRLIGGKNGITVHLKNGPEIPVDRVVLCCGGNSAPATGSDGSGFRIARELGHTLIYPRPSLVQIKLEGDSHRIMEGVRWEGKITLKAGNKEAAVSRGDILFTAYGLSGMAVLDISGETVAAVNRRQEAVLEIDLFPEMVLQQKEDAIRSRVRRMPDRKMEHFFTGWLNKRIGMAVVKASAIDLSKEAGDLSDREQKNLARHMEQLCFRAVGDTGWAHSQVTAGGVDCREVSPETLESAICPGLFFAGEILDIDGDCGGYNLQWAWTSGFIAGQAAST